MSPGSDKQEDMMQLDRRQVQRAFDRAASSYDQAAVLQQRVSQQLTGRLDYIRHQHDVVLDLGCGTGQLSVDLLKRFPQSQIMAVDISPAMIRQAQLRFREQVSSWRCWLGRTRRPLGICAMAEHLPVKSSHCDSVISNLTLQWCGDLTQVFGELRRVLKPGGLLMFTTFGPDTLKELRSSWAEVDNNPRVNQFLDMHDVGDALLACGFENPVMDMEQITLTYSSVMDIMRDLQAIGATNAHPGRMRGLTGKRQLAAMIDSYEQFRRPQGLPASYEVVFGHAWLPQTADQTISVEFMNKV